MYKYLGVYLDNHLNLHHHFEKVYKKASSRIKLLSRIREQIGPHVAESIYKAMIRPILMYCYQQQLGLPKGTIDKRQSIQNRAVAITNPSEPPQNWDKVAEVRNSVAIDVFKCLNGLSPDQFKNYFKRHQHGKDTRGNNSSLVLPSIRTEAGKRMVAFQGAQIFNKFPKDIRDESSLVLFKQKLSIFKGL